MLKYLEPVLLIVPGVGGGFTSLHAAAVTCTVTQEVVDGVTVLLPCITRCLGPVSLEPASEDMRLKTQHSPGAWE